MNAMPNFIRVILICSSLLMAQPQAQSVFSPIVHADKTITFNFRSPNAQKVEVALDNGKRFPLVKDEKNVWSVTTPPLEPNLYGYTFQVDGVGTIDPINGDIKTNLLGPNSMVLVPGDQPQPWEFTQVPHGSVHHHFFHSAIANENRDFYVYTPPGYQASKRYPLLVLLHGYSDGADGWTTVGKANFIFDNLIASGKKPFIAVMPLGYGVSQKDLRSGQALRGENANKNGVLFAKSLLEEVLPAAEKEYKISSKANERAIAGLSMGGAETLYVGLKNTDKFAWIGAMSSATGLIGKPEEVLANLTEKDNDRLKLLWIACGKDDRLIKSNQTFSEWLKSRKIEHKYVETEGAHTWLVWRRYLTDFMSQVNW